MARLFVVILAILCSVVFAHERHTFAWTNQGLIRGLIRDNTQVFLGVPFAAPPQRFKPPLPPPFRWYLFDATKHGNACPQPTSTGFLLNEDCLNLAIYAPKHACRGSKLPVLVYWDGGAFIYGSNSRPVNNAQQLAKEGNMIVVVANHRLGALGFLYIDELTQADGYKHNKVNFAMLDMIRALKWVKHNIGHFGGDASQVTIGGLSSGAFMTSWLTTIPQSWGLFNNVLQIEGPLTALIQAVVYSKETANDVGHNFTALVGCTGDANTVMKCLATADLLTLATVWPNFVMLPVVDGDLFPENPDLAISNPASGNVKPAPSFMVANPNPGTYFVDPYVELAAVMGWNNMLSYLFTPQVGYYLQLQYSDAVYGNESYASIFARGSELISDAVWLCPVRRHANFLLSFTPNVFVATWNTRASFINIPEQYGIVHGTAVPFLFGNAVDIVTQQQGQFTPTEAQISKNFIEQVAHFVRTGKPTSQFPPWVASPLEVNTLINPDAVPTVSDVLYQIRTPPSGLLPRDSYPTRCTLFDFFFYESLGGQLSEDELLQRYEKNGGNFWNSKPKDKQRGSVISSQ